MRCKFVFYSGLLFVTTTFMACREKRMNNLIKDHCPARASILPQGDSAVILFPSAFTPNGDGLNDTWHPVFNQHITALEIRIIDLKGKLQFTGNDLNASWKPMNDANTGITRYIARVKATSTSGNVVDACMDVYTYYCTPKNAPIDNSQLLFADQLDPNRPGNYLPTRENLDLCK